MNPLQEHPNLFANGEFKLKWGYDFEDEKISKFTASKLQGITKDLYNRYTLIARPISDMTDGEVEDIYNVSCETIVELSYDSCEQMRGFWEERTKSGNLKFVTARWMLKKGVYPFDQKHFDDGTVIDSTTL